MDRIVEHNRALTRSEVMATNASSGRMPAVQNSEVDPAAEGPQS
jgi:hypothetical protein